MNDWKKLECGNGCCCPDARKLNDNTVEIKENGVTQDGKTIRLSLAQINALAHLLDAEIW